MKSNGFKQTEIGLIPEGWEVVRLGEMLKKLLKNRKTKGKEPLNHEKG